MKTDGLRVWFADLSYTQQTISSETMPAAVGCVGSFLRRHGPPGVQVKLFKYPGRLVEELDRGAPEIAAFSNYVWNLDLSHAFAAAIKRAHPATITVFGGPNFPVEPNEQEAFLRRHPAIDFYVMKEGEAAFVELVKTLAGEGLDPARLDRPIPSVAYLAKADDRFYHGDILPRIKDLTDIPSPYLDGLMDEFFDGLLQPIIQTNRGCPFECTFCIEGMGYYTKVFKTKKEKVAAEIDYIARKMAAIRDKGGRNDLFIADSNFAMFKEDVETCAVIASAKARYQWPDYISVATGKNNRERVLESAALLSGSMRLAGSVQSLTPQVLANIKRGNISADGLMDVALKANAIGTNSYTEVIIGLPGETLASLYRTLETVLSSDFLTVQIYQLMLLPGTEMASRAAREQYAMQSRYRALPRCYGFYDWGGRAIDAAEIEEICVATNTFSYADYLEACRFRFFVSTFYNDGAFLGLTKVLKSLGLSCYDWLQDIARYPYHGAVAGLLADLERELEAELWTDKAALREHLNDRKTLQRYIDGELGSNLMFKYKTLAFLRHVDEFCSVAAETLERRVRAAPDGGDLAAALVRELAEYHRCERAALLDTQATFTAPFRFDVIRFLASQGRAAPLNSYLLPAPREILFAHSAGQRDSIHRYLNVFGSSLPGQTRMMAKVYVKKLFRAAEYVA